MTVVDAHRHWMPKQHIDEFERYLRPGEHVVRGDGLVRVRRGDIELFTINVERYSSPELHIREMDAKGIDVSVLGVGLWQEWNTTVELSREINDYMAEVQRAYPTRLVGLAHVPPFEREGLNELDRAIKVLGLRGIGICTHTDDKYLDAPEFRPLYRKAVELDVPVFVHGASTPLVVGPLADYDLARGFGRAYEHTVATARLLYSGILGDFPQLKIVMGHLGGTFSIMKDFLTLTIPGRHAKPVLPYDEYLKCLYFDTAGAAATTAAGINVAVQTLGVDHILFGTDYPASMDVAGRQQRVMSLSIPEQDRDALLGNNAAQLFGLTS